MGEIRKETTKKSKHINSKTCITRRSVDTIQNPADIGSRGSNTENLPNEWGMVPGG